MITASMLLVTSTWGPEGQAKDTFKMIPATENCPYQECIYDPFSLSLAVISKIPMKKFVMVPKLDAGGLRLPIYEKKGSKQELVGFKQERVQVDSYQEFYIENKGEIRDFVKMFSITPTKPEDGFGFDLDKYLNAPAIPAGEVALADVPKEVAEA